MDSDSNSDMEQFTDSDIETSESDVEEIENTDSFVRISVRVEHGKIQKPRPRNWKNFRGNKWKGRNNKRVVDTGVNSEGNYYTKFSDGSYRYDNSDGYHYKNANGKSVLFIISKCSKCLKIVLRQHIHPKRRTWNLQGPKWQKMDQEAQLRKFKLLITNVGDETTLRC